MEGQKDLLQFPHEIKNVDADTTQHLLSYFTEHNGYVRVGKHGYFLPDKYRQEAQHIYNMEVRPDDVWLTSFPRSGTTLTRELVWLLANDLDYETAAKIPLNDRFPWLEFQLSIHDEVVDRMFEENKNNEEQVKVLESMQFNTPTWKIFKDMKTSRFIQAHLPLSLLPPTLLDARVVYVARDPRDVVVSFYHLNRLSICHGFIGDFKTFWDFFRKDQVRWTPYFSHVKEFWARRNETNVLFLFYEDLTKDRQGQLRRVSEFLGKSYSDDQIIGLSEHLNIENFRKNSSVNPVLSEPTALSIPGEQQFIRNGRSGGWRDYFEGDMTLEAENWIKDNLKDTDLKFPSFP